MLLKGHVRSQEITYILRVIKVMCIMLTAGFFSKVWKMQFQITPDL